MANQVQSSTVRFILVFTLLGAIALWMHSANLRAQHRERMHLQDVDACRSIAAQIERLRSGKQRALLKTKPTDELNRKIADWASQAEIPADRLIRIEPRLASRIGDSPYLEQVTELEIMQTELPKLIELALTAEYAEEGLKVSAMRLSIPRSRTTHDGSERWNVELTLTYLIYSPTSGRP